jgi:hypothetical protein
VALIRALRVYDRWGAAVYAAANAAPNDESAYWDGNVRGQPAEAGVYVYVIEIQFIDGEVAQYGGDVSIVR